MPQPLIEPPLDAILALHERGVTIRNIAGRLGISRSFTQRYLASIHPVVVLPERVAAGAEPLPTGHPLSWCAISALPFEPGASA